MDNWRIPRVPQGKKSSSKVSFSCKLLVYQGVTILMAAKIRLLELASNRTDLEDVGSYQILCFQVMSKFNGKIAILSRKINGINRVCKLSHHCLPLNYLYKRIISSYCVYILT